MDATTSVLLTDLRAFVQRDVDSLREAHQHPTRGTLDADGTAAVAEAQRLLARIDAALGRKCADPAICSASPGCRGTGRCQREQLRQELQ